MSSYCKGLLAHILDTTIPSGRKIQVCHACHNPKCSNPNHLYWGTPSENLADAHSQGKPISPWHAMVAKHGEEYARAKVISNLDPAKGGRGNKGTTKSEEHKRKIAEAIRRKHKDRMR